MTRNHGLLAAWLCITALTGCGGRGVGTQPDGSPRTDAGVGADAATWPDGGAPTAFGTLRLRHDVQDGDSPYEEATLQAFFYDTNQRPAEPEEPGFVEQRLTPDAVACDIYFTAPDWGGGAPPPEPPEVDVGEIRVSGSLDNDAALVTRWNGTGYEPDTRYRSTNGGDLPGWFQALELEVRAEYLGNTRLTSFTDRLSLVDVPEILSPGPWELSLPNSAGHFLISWSTDPSHPVEVRLDMNMDWDNAVFRCEVPAGQESLTLPQTWLSEYSWGWAELRVIAQQDEQRAGPNSLVSYQIRRSAHRSVEFEIQW